MRTKAGARYHGRLGGADLAAPLAERTPVHVRDALYPHDAVVWKVADQPCHGRQLLEAPAPTLLASAHEQCYGPLGPVSVGFSRVPIERPPAGRAPRVPILRFRDVIRN